MENNKKTRTLTRQLRTIEVLLKKYQALMKDSEKEKVLKTISEDDRKKYSHARLLNSNRTDLVEGLSDGINKKIVACKLDRLEREYKEVFEAWAIEDRTEGK